MHHETATASRWLLLILVLALGGASLGLRDALLGDGSLTGRVLTGAIMVAIVLILLAVAFWFTRLRVTVRGGMADSMSGGSLHFSFGPIRRTIDGPEIGIVHVERYEWRRFGGWGIRFGHRDGYRARAWTVPFLRTGVWVGLREGSGYYLSSARPESLAAAIRGIQRTGTR